MASVQEKLLLSSTSSSFHSFTRILVPRSPSRITVTRSNSCCCRSSNPCCYVPSMACYIVPHNCNPVLCRSNRKIIGHRHGELLKTRVVAPRNSAISDGAVSYKTLVSEAVRLLVPQANFDSSKLRVEFLGELLERGDIITPRTYILSHCDFTANLTLTISNVINLDQLEGWYKKDDVVAEWKKVKDQLRLHIHCCVSGPSLLQDVAAELRYHIFSKELPLVLKAVLHGDSLMFRQNPELMDAYVWVYFHSSSPKYNRIECWGPLNDAAKMCLMESPSLSGMIIGCQWEKSFDIAVPTGPRLLGVPLLKKVYGVTGLTAEALWALLLKDTTTSLIRCSTFHLLLCSKWYGEERPRWFGPIPYDYPSYLTGEVPGDYGFDIAGLGKDRSAFDKYFNFEILHARWAMLAALGALIPQVFDLTGAFRFAEPVWWRVGYSKLQGETLDYLGIRLHVAGSQGVIVGPEYARYCGIEALEPLGIYLPGDINYPGGTLFDPLNLSEDPVAFEDLKVKEIKNGGLAMVAWLGFYAQAAFTGKGPIQNLVEHVSDPLHNNLFALLQT